MTRIQIPEHRLGRHIDHDERSRAYVAEQASKIISVKHQAHGLPLNQGNVGMCTATALVGALNSDPDYKGHTRDIHDARNLYGRETADEGEPWPPNDPGGTGLAVCKAAKELGWIRSYTHAFGLDQALKALVKRPVITGINWYSSFDTPAASGLVRIAKGAIIRGGHEIVADEIDTLHRIIWFWNSWGPDYGLKGRFAMTWNTWDRLLKEQGDVTIPLP